MTKDTNPNRDELTEKMHSEFTINEYKEKALKVILAKQDIKDFKYSVAQVCELYGLSEEEFGIVENS